MTVQTGRGVSLKAAHVSAFREGSL